MMDRHEQPDLPSFVRTSDRTKAPNLAHSSLDWWSPHRTGGDIADYKTGQSHFATAVAYSRSIGSNYIISSIIGEMFAGPLGAIEMGFIDALASKAAFGRRPPPLSVFDIESSKRINGFSEEEILHGEAQAIAYLELSRSHPSGADILKTILVRAIRGEFGPAAVSFIFTICAASQLGLAN